MNQFPHMCQDGHEPIGFSNGPAEEQECCPVCLLRRKLSAIGEVYRAPADWDYPGMGGPPSFEDCEKINLADL